jgi:hypothetical protein
LRPGCRADLVVLGADIGVLGVMSAGEWEIEPPRARSAAAGGYGSIRPSKR